MSSNESTSRKKPVDEHCHKCGGTDINLSFLRKGDDFSKCSTVKYPQDSDQFVDWKSGLYSVKVLEDCIVYTCRTCGYAWTSAPLDTNTHAVNNMNEDETVS